MLKKITRFCALLFLFAALDLSAEYIPHTTIDITMRDGHILKTDIYLPPSKNKNLPSLLVRSPSGREGAHAKAFAAMSEWDYIIAIQETRSSQDSEGRTMPYLHDQNDGFDTVEWLSKSDWSNGKVGTAGASALGITQLLMAPTAPEGLVAQHIRVAAPSLYDHVIYGSGQFAKEKVETWLGHYAPHPEVLDFVKSQPNYNEFWHNFNTVEQAEKVNAPAIHVAGWYDIFLEGSIDAFVSRQERGGEGARNQQKIVIGPWTHFWPLQQELGDFSVPENALQLPDALTEKAWFDHHLKEIDTGTMQQPAVTYFVMGPLDGTPSKGNVWRTADTWPIPAKETSMYLSVNGGLGEKAVVSKDTLSFIHDPKNPVPTIGGRNLYIESGPKNQHEIEQRDDVLVFTSEPLDNDLEVTGHLFAKLYLETDSPDTDIAVRLCDVYPDGRSILIAGGLKRLHGDSHKVNELEPVVVDLAATSQVFGKGHKIRLSISGSNYPCYENSNNGITDTEGRSIIAHNTFHFSLENPSELILPVVN